jgi:lipoprotein
MKRTALIIAGLAVLSCGQKKVDPSTECMSLQAPADFVQPDRSGAEIFPLTSFSYFEGRKLKDVCQIYKVVRNDDGFALGRMGRDDFIKLAGKRIALIESERKSFLKKIYQLEKDSGINLTEFERELLSNFYVIGKYRLKIYAKGKYVYADPLTPEKLNFAARELGIGNLTSNMEYFARVNGKAWRRDTAQLERMNTPYAYPNSKYVTVFKGYGKDTMPQAQQEQAKPAENAAAAQQTQTVQEAPQAIYTPPAYVPQTSPSEIGIQDQGTSQVQETSEIPVPEKPEYTPKKPEKPSYNGIRTQDSYPKRPSRGKNESQGE